jgi:tellurite resistance protein
MRDSLASGDAAEVLMRREVTHLTGEGEYFHRVDADQIANMRRCAELREQRLLRERASSRRRAEVEQQYLELAAALNIHDPEILHSLQQLGYTPAIASLIHLAAPVWIAWADGSVSRSERRLIYGLANLLGVVADSPAFSRLSAWLDRRPRESLLQGSWAAVVTILESLPPEEGSANKDRILKECRAVAAKSGLILHRICAAERTLLTQMERDLKAQSVEPAGFP